VYEAKTNLPRLLDEVQRGEPILITRHGRPVAELRPVSPGGTTQEAIDAIREVRKGQRLDGLNIKQLIQEGRR
jgi:prevent-host-death family protein